MVSFRVNYKVWVIYIMFLSNGIFRSQSRGRLFAVGSCFSLAVHLFVVKILNGILNT